MAGVPGFGPGPPGSKPGILTVGPHPIELVGERGSAPRSVAHRATALLLSYSPPSPIACCYGARRADLHSLTPDGTGCSSRAAAASSSSGGWRPADAESDL